MMTLDEERKRRIKRGKRVYLLRRKGLTWKEIGNKLNDPSREYARSIMFFYLHDLKLRAKESSYPFAKLDDVRAINCLKTAKLLDIEKLKKTPDAELLKIRHLGKYTLKLIKEFLKDINKGEHNERVHI
jgi:hypothetical protein